MGIGALSFLMFGNVLASTPLWTLTPVAGSQTTLSVSPTGSAVVQYTVQNHSNRIKNLVITPMPGVTQTTPCQLAPGSQCILNLAISGKELPAKESKRVLLYAKPISMVPLFLINAINLALTIV